MAKKVLMVGTNARGGMSSVIKAYDDVGFLAAESAQVIFTHDDGSLLKRLWLAFSAYIHIFVLLLMRQVDLIHVHVAERGSFFRKSVIFWLAKMAGVPVIFHMHAAEFREFYAHCPAIVQRYIAWVLSHCSYIIVLSQSWKSYYQGICSAPIDVIANFVVDNFPVPQSLADKQEMHVLFLGRMGQRKGIYDLLDAAVSVCHQRKDIHFWCAGDGEVEQVKAAAKQKGIGDNFHVLGWINAHERKSLLEKCHVFTLPSYNEGLPMAIIEAMSAGLVVVSTTAGGIPEMIESGDNGLLIEAGDSAALASIFVQLASDNALCQRLAANARQTFERNYSAAVVTAKVSRIYQQLTM